jgi:4-hydroxy-3-polyprenylbenzoate decarboxylase
VNDLREWILKAQELNQLRTIYGADCDVEIGAITEMVCLRSKHPKALLFDRIKDYPPGWRILSNVFANQELAAMTLELPFKLTAGDFTKAWRRKAKQLVLRPAKEVNWGPILENVRFGKEIDLNIFPSPKWHEKDGGRYLGTGNIVVTRDPENGQVNVGVYRMMLHACDKLGLFIAAGHHGRVHREKYFAYGKPMPVVAVFGMDPLLFTAGALALPISVNEFEWVGGIKDTPVEVIRGRRTGLPIPSTAEIAVEGYVYPGKTMPEGPFGEFTGYYASAIREETYVEVETVYFRNDPIVLGSPPMRPPSGHFHVRLPIVHALIWDALEDAGVPDVRGVTYLPFSGYGFLVIALKQRYAGHAKQAAMIAAQCKSGAYLGRYIVVVDDDIDPYDTNEVLWAIWTRSDPEDSVDLVRRCWSSPLDPRISPDRRATGDFTNSRMIIDATRPFEWADKFPESIGVSKELQMRLKTKWGSELFD